MSLHQQKRLNRHGQCVYSNVKFPLDILCILFQPFIKAIGHVQSGNIQTHNTLCFYRLKSKRNNRDVFCIILYAFPQNSLARSFSAGHVWYLLETLTNTTRIPNHVWTSLGCTTCFCNDRRTAESDRVKEAKNVFNHLGSLNLLHESYHLKQIVTRFSTT